MDELSRLAVWLKWVVELLIHRIKRVLLFKIFGERVGGAGVGTNQPHPTGEHGCQHEKRDDDLAGPIDDCVIKPACSRLNPITERHELLLPPVEDKTASAHNQNCDNDDGNRKPTAFACRHINWNAIGVCELAVSVDIVIPEVK